MSGVEPALLIAGATAVGTVASTAIAASQSGPDTDPVIPDADDGELSADSRELARRRRLIQRRRGTDSLSFDPATSSTGLEI